jgi:hypothetical protein
LNYFIPDTIAIEMLTPVFSVQNQDESAPEIIGEAGQFYGLGADHFPGQIIFLIAHPRSHRASGALADSSRKLTRYFWQYAFRYPDFSR